jgi:2-polyprenyl-3-methyl-5-hydroxy-6-metoxy-1,4-benzoquinol methylase
MVAEHIADPASLLDALSRNISPGGQVVVYTVSLWSALSMAAWMTPFSLHHPLKKVAWGTEEKDTFPVVYRMNTRSALTKAFASRGFREVQFTRLADLRTSYRSRTLSRMELALWRVLKAIRIPYPEGCLLAVYTHQDQTAPKPNQKSA